MGKSRDLADSANIINYLDSLSSDIQADAAITGGTIDGTTIGGTTPAAITGTTITGTTFVGDGAGLRQLYRVIGEQNGTFCKSSRWSSGPGYRS